jgi:hypothetical protein
MPPRLKPGLRTQGRSGRVSILLRSRRYRRPGGCRRSRRLPAFLSPALPRLRPSFETLEASSFAKAMADTSSGTPALSTNTYSHLTIPDKYSYFSTHGDPENIFCVPSLRHSGRFDLKPIR